MLVPINWLKKYVDFDLDAMQIADKLVDCGFEVEQIIDFEKEYEKIFTCKILSIETHPNANNLKVCKVELKKNEHKQIVTNSNILNVGDMVFVALEGASLFNGIQIAKTKLRGILSEGMFCGLEELNLSKDSFYFNIDENNIIKLLDKPNSGIRFIDYWGIDDTVLDVSITSNRPDANSVLGIAREVASILDKKIKTIEKLSLDYNENLSKKIIITNKDEKKCEVYLSAIIENAKILPTPNEIKSKLNAVGIKSINNFVDLTNYIMIAIGQPMHAFDYDKITNNEIIVRNATQNEEILTLDEKVYKLSKEDLVIANSKSVMAIAGALGGLNSGITLDTKTVVLESALFNKETVRKTSKRLGIRTSSSAIFEKGVNATTQLLAIEMFLYIVEKHKWGKVTRQYTGFSKANERNHEISFSSSDIERILGITVNENKIMSILEGLNFKINKHDKGFLVVAPPYRSDIFTVNDIAEEIIRIYGYDKLETSKNSKVSLAVGSMGNEEECINKIRNLAIYNGMYEIMTYSFVSPVVFDKINLNKDDQLRETISLYNPLGSDMSVMRTTLVPCMLSNMEKNYNRSNKKGQFFEISKVYCWENEKKSATKETLMLCLGSYDSGDFYSLKSIIEAIFCKLSIEDISFEIGKYPFLHPYRSANVFIGKGSTKIKVGFIGQINNDLLDNYNLSENSYVSELNLELILNSKKGYKGYKLISKYQPVERDFAIVCDRDTQAQKIIDIITAASTPYLRTIEIFDIYQGSQISKDKKSVAFRVTLQSNESSLNEKEINRISNEIIDSLYKNINASLR